MRTRREVFCPEVSTFFVHHASQECTNLFTIPVRQTYITKGK